MPASHPGRRAGRKGGRGGRSAQRELLASIKGEAWRQICTSGAPALSLRGIARSLGITAPAIYNYFHRRDDLVTALIADAYDSFGASQSAALSGTSPTDHAGRLLALGKAYRAWALANPERYQLMFGAPYPGYRIPPETVGPAAGRALGVLVGVLEQARRAGRLGAAGGRASTPALGGIPDDRLAVLYGSADEGVLSAAVRVWPRVHGPVSVELSGQCPPFVTDPARLYGEELGSLVSAMIIPKAKAHRRANSRRRAKGL